MTDLPSSTGSPDVRLGDLVSMGRSSPYFHDWLCIEMKVVSLRQEPNGKLWASVIEKPFDQGHRGFGYYDGETTEVDADHLVLVTPRDVAQGAGDCGDWREDPGADERWNAGLEFAMEQLCLLLGVDQKAVNWDAATETLDGDVQSVMGNILRVKLGEDWGPRDPAYAPIDPTNHHNALKCPHCNPDDAVRKAVIEECAKVAEGPLYQENYRGKSGNNWWHERQKGHDHHYGNGRHDAAAAIRALSVSSTEGKNDV